MSIQATPDIDKRFIGVPYELGGKSFQGADCMNIVLLWYKENGISFSFNEKDAAKFKKAWESSPQTFIETVLKYGNIIMFQEIRKFDFLLFFSNDDQMFPTWPAVMVDDRHFLISVDKKESQVHMINEFWKKRFWGSIRPKQVV